MAITFTAGQLITAAELNLLTPLFATKATNTANASAVAVQIPDPDLILTVVPNQTVHLTAHLLFQCTSATLQVRSAWNITGTLTQLMRLAQGPSDVAATGPSDAMTTWQSRPLAAFTTGQVYGTGTANSSYYAREELTFTTGASGGTIQWMFGTNAAGASTATSMAGAFVIARYVA